MPWEIPVNTEAQLAGPAGYKQYIWRVDHRQVSTEATLKYIFKEAGAHQVECVASTPNGGLPQGFLRVRYNAAVKGK